MSESIAVIGNSDSIEYFRILGCETYETMNGELAKLVEKEKRITASIEEGKTRRGKPLTKRGLRLLLGELRGAHISQTITILEGCSLSESCARQEHNRFLEAVCDAGGRQ